MGFVTINTKSSLLLSSAVSLIKAVNLHYCAADVVLLPCFGFAPSILHPPSWMDWSGFGVLQWFQCLPSCLLLISFLSVLKIFMSAPDRNRYSVFGFDFTRLAFLLPCPVKRREVRACIRTRERLMFSEEWDNFSRFLLWKTCFYFIYFLWVGQHLFKSREAEPLTLHIRAEHECKNRMMKAAAFCVLLNATRSEHCSLPLASPRGQRRRAARTRLIGARTAVALLSVQDVLCVDVVVCIMWSRFLTDQPNGLGLHGMWDDGGGVGRGM